MTSASDKLQEFITSRDERGAGGFTILNIMFLSTVQSYAYDFLYRETPPPPSVSMRIIVRLARILLLVPIKGDTLP